MVLDIISGDPSCTACPLHKETKHVCHPAYRDVLSQKESDTVLLFLGDRPGFHENDSGLPFTGPTGVLLCASPGVKVDILPVSILEMIEARQRATVWIANALRCYGPAEHPPKLAYVQCSTYLVELMEEIWRPRAAVICMGPGAINSVLRIGGHPPLGLAKSTHLQGTKLYLPKAWTFFAMPNPAILFARRSPEKGKSIARYCTLIRSYLDGYETSPSRPIPLDPATGDRLVPLTPQETEECPFETSPSDTSPSHELPFESRLF